jgi:hypothetical protein
MTVRFLMHPAGAETTHAVTLSSHFSTSTSPVIGLKPSLIYYRKLRAYFYRILHVCCTSGREESNSLR